MVKDILVIDDEEEMRDALREALNSYGYNVTTASSGKEGLDVFLAQPFSVVVTDVKMPGISGIDLLREIRQKNSEIPVLIITAYGAVEDAVEAMKYGAFDYLLKPFSADILEGVINNAFRHLSGSAPHGISGLTKVGKPQKKSNAICSDPAMKQVLELAKDIAATPSTVLLQGESGTGKEVMARFIHENSDRSGGPFVAVNCAALPKDLLESELFGHEKGAFTGAIGRKTGKFEMASNGTILLDEISEIEKPLQAKLLRVLQEKEVDRVGGGRPVSVNIRVIATTNRDLQDAVNKGEFREDLFYRLNVIPILLPPLRERRGDIKSLTEFFIGKHARTIGRPVTGISDETLNLLVKAPWRGNVRELENTIERAVILCKGNELIPENLMMTGNGKKPGEGAKQESVVKSGQTLWEMERELIMATLKDQEDNRTHAADTLGISIRTLRNKLKEYKEKGYV